MYVCLYACVYVRVYTYVYVCMYVCMYVCVCVFVCVFVCLFVSVFLPIHQTDWLSFLSVCITSEHEHSSIPSSSSKFVAESNGNFPDLIIVNAFKTSERALLKVQLLYVPELGPRLLLYAKRLDNRSDMIQLELDLLTYFPLQGEGGGDLSHNQRKFEFSERVKEGLFYGIFEFAGASLPLPPPPHTHINL